MHAIVCVSENWGIGRDGRLLFHIPADLKRFRELTVGKTVIFGSRTLRTFPDGKPLPGRRNIILSRSAEGVEGAELAHTVQETLALTGGEDACVIGGASVYTLLLPYCDRVLVTKVLAAEKADSYFPNLDNHPDWRVDAVSEVMEENGLRFRYVDYIRK